MLRHKKKPPKHDDKRARKTFVVFPVSIDDDTEAYLQFVYIVEKYDNNNKQWKPIKYFLTYVKAQQYAIGHDTDATIKARIGRR